MSDKHLIIGFGTGRSGTTSLSSFLNAQDRVRVLHEGRMDSKIPGKPFAWTGDETRVLEWLSEIMEEKNDYRWVGDIGMYYINYVDEIMRVYPGVKFICMQRSCEAVVRSYMEWTQDKNHWMEHDGKRWKSDPKWDKAYPKFNVKSKEEALRMYWMSYAQQTRELQLRLPEQIKVVHLEEFNDQNCRESILDFMQYTGHRYVDFNVESNSVRKRNRRRRKREIVRAFWSLKTKLIGRPGDRWFTK